MEWLKTILEKATITDGKLDIDATMKSINAEFPKHAVPKQDYNDKVKELSTANDTIKDLKKNNADNADLQKKVEDYETEVANLKTAAANTKKEYALKDKLREAGATDADYIIQSDNLAVFIERELIQTALFKTAGGTKYNPAGGGNPPTVNPFAKDTFNLTEQGRMLRQYPEQAREMAAAAGVKI